MEKAYLQRRKSLESKIPEISKSLETVEFLLTRKDSQEPLDAQYELNDTLWAHAKIQNAKTVNIWLGANVMVEYTLEEAEKLLKEKLEKATLSLAQLTEDLEYLKDQYTTMEVNIARVHNADVQKRRVSKSS